eukprot:13379729-Heterocapsa_arctica.AAC.1
MSPPIYLSSVAGAVYRAVGAVEETHAKLVLKLTFPIHQYRVYSIVYSPRGWRLEYGDKLSYYSGKRDQPSLVSWPALPT